MSEEDKKFVRRLANEVTRLSKQMATLERASRKAEVPPHHFYMNVECKDNPIDRAFGHLRAEPFR